MFYESKHLGKNGYFCREEGTNYCFPTHMHSAFELIVILEGSMDVTIDSKVYTLEKNEAVLIFPHQLHSLNSKESRHVLYIFSPDLIQAFYTKVLAKTPINNKMVLNEHLLAFLCELTENSPSIEKKGTLYSVCAKFHKENTYTDKASDKKNLLYKIFEYIELNFGGDCMLKDLAEKLSYDHAYLSRYFKQNVGMSFNSYVNMYRINKACELLDTADCSVLQCAMECGYASLRTFNRNFKEITALSPAEYKKNRSKK